jgi:uncharacterized membrane protein YfcA
VTYQLVLAGFLVGGLVGVSGTGGGSLMTPLLVILFGFSPTTAIGTDIFHGAMFKSVAAIRHRRLGTVQGRLSGWMLVGSAPTSLLGVWLATWLRHRYGSGLDATMGIVLGSTLVAAALGLTAKALLTEKAVDTPFVLRRRDRIAAVLIGLVGGFVVGLTSVGSGVFFGVTLLVVFPLRAAKVVGTDIFHAAVLLWVASAGHLLAGDVDLHAAGWLLLGSVPGVLATSRFTVRVPERPLRLGLAAVLLLSGVKLLELPGGALNAAVLGGSAAAAGALFWLASRHRRAASSGGSGLALRA